uniref:C2H2-type domain-containing protein n=1 Tax=Caenorhabditis tropicalis TaxID=1561998 RepID=A0A1I7UAH4_9PELO
MNKECFIFSSREGRFVHRGCCITYRPDHQSEELVGKMEDSHESSPAASELWPQQGGTNNAVVLGARGGFKIEPHQRMGPRSSPSTIPLSDVHALMDLQHRRNLEIQEAHQRQLREAQAQNNEFMLKMMQLVQNSKKETVTMTEKQHVPEETPELEDLIEEVEEAQEAQNDEGAQEAEQVEQDKDAFDQEAIARLIQSIREREQATSEGLQKEEEEPKMKGKSRRPNPNVTVLVGKKKKKVIGKGRWYARNKNSFTNFVCKVCAESYGKEEELKKHWEKEHK